MKEKASGDRKALIRRYLIWCYKTTKEDLDRIERKFTQLEVDDFLKKEILKRPELADPVRSREYQAKVGEFLDYIATKEKGAGSAKYLDEKQGVLQPGYWYLAARLKAIRQAIKHFLGAVELKQIETLYEQEMTRRILASTEH